MMLALFSLADFIYAMSYLILSDYVAALKGNQHNFFDNGISTIEIRYYITSLDITEISDFKRAIRDEWGIENDLHWHLDYTFKEDYSKTIDKNAQANLNILRKLSLNILKLVQPLYNISLKRIRSSILQGKRNFNL